MSNPKKNFGTSSTTPSSFSMPWQRSSSEIELTSKSGNNSETYPNYNVPNIQSQGQPGSSASRGSYKSNKYKGWKLSIPVPTYFSPREEYDSQCIEMYGGYYERDQDSSSSPSHTKYDSSFLPFVKLPRSIHDTFSTSRSSTKTSHSGAAGTTTAAAWTYSAPHLTNWKISSQSLLTVTYKKSIHCIPDYTNRSVCVDYFNRAIKLSSCRKNACSSEMNHAACYNSSSSDSNCTAHTNNDVPTVYKEKYTEQDIAAVKTYNIKIMGFTGDCTAVQIYLHSKQFNYDQLSVTHKKHTGATTARQLFDVHNEYDDNNDEEEEQETKRLSPPLSPLHPPPKLCTTNNSNMKRPTSPNAITNNRFEHTNTSKERKLYEKLKPYLERSFDNDRVVPSDGQSTLEKNGYGIDNDYGLPLPPWHPDVENDHFMNDKYGGIFYGPILTFAIPNMLDENQMDHDDSHHHSIQDTAPLLWKIDFPPDPSIAIEAFTVLDGVLDVHPSSINDHDDDDDESTSSYSSCSKDDCEACHPTNIYINGYQSWSYTGSVKQGAPQPTSAMPEFLSKAFNYGADVPPVAGSVVDNNRKWDDEDSNIIGFSPRKRKSDQIGNNDYNSSGRDHDDDYYPFHEAVHYKSDFYTCVSTKSIEKMKAQRGASGLADGSVNQHLGMKVDEMGGTHLVLGFLSQRKQLGLITFDSELERVAMHASLQGVIASRANGISTDWAYCQILPVYAYDEEPLVYYLNAVSSYNNARPLQNHPPLTGWCSWYHYYENISLATLNTNFEKMSGLKSTISQDLAIIDDGYITAWGDWDSLKSKEFPKAYGGMKALANNIRMNKMMPGLWMAPFACDKHSKLAEEHPDWIIRNDEGRVANSANCGKFFYGLDATNPAVREYAFNCVRRAVEEWGYRCLKLDFLYASCLDGNGKYDLSMSRAETMYLALQTLRAAAGPDVFLIGCGCPLGPAIGYVDGMRISADTGPTWYPDFPLPWWDQATLPSLRAMIRNSTTRACLGHRWWHNDPDCVLLGETTSLSDNEVVSAATIVAMTGGMLLLSDDLTQLSNERISVATRVFPVTGVTAVVLDLHNFNRSGIPSLLRLWCTDTLDTPDALTSLNLVEMASQNSKRSIFCPTKPWKNPSSRERNCIPVAKGLGTWSIVSFSNWLDVENIVSVPISSLLPPKSIRNDRNGNELDLGYHVYAFWSSKYIWVSNSKFEDQKTISKRLGPHETEIFHVKPVHASLPQYVGSELHFTCGYEVKQFAVSPNSITLQMRNESKRSGYIYLFLPTFNSSIQITIDGKIVRAENIATTPEIKQGNQTHGGQIIRVFMVINGPATLAKLHCTFQ